MNQGKGHPSYVEGRRNRREQEGVSLNGRTEKNRMALLSQMWWQNKNADTATYGAGGFPSILSEVQIHLRDLF